MSPRQIAARRLRESRIAYRERNPGLRRYLLRRVRRRAALLMVTDWAVAHNRGDTYTAEILNRMINRWTGHPCEDMP